MRGLPKSEYFAHLRRCREDEEHGEGLDGNDASLGGLI